MSKYLVETFYTCTFKIVHKLNELNEKKLSELEKRNDGEVQIIDVKLNSRKTKTANNKRLETSWRRPRGFDSKMRINKKGWPATVNIGYGGPKTQRGLHPSGYRDILIHSLKDLADVNPEIDAIRISAKIGRRYKQEIITQADSSGIKVLNRSITKRKK